MFRTEQIIAATYLVKPFRMIARFLEDNPQPLLVSQKSSRFVVVVPAELFQYFVLSNAKGEVPKENAITVRDYTLSKRRI